MSKLILVLLIFTFSLGVPAQKSISDRERTGLIGLVKSIKYEYTLLPESENSSYFGKCLFCNETFFDKDGNFVLEMIPGLNYKWTKNIIDGFITYKFSEIVEKPKYNGFYSYPISPEKPIEEPENLVPPDERYTNKYVFEFDSLGRIKKERKFQNDGRLLNKSINIFDEKGRLIERNYETRSEKGQTIYKYDAKDNLIETLDSTQSRVGGKDDQMKSVYSDYKLDSLGNWIYRKVITTFNDLDNPLIIEELEFRKIIYY
jgi:hypothetical protein